MYIVSNLFSFPDYFLSLVCKNGIAKSNSRVFFIDFMQISINMLVHTNTYAHMNTHVHICTCHTLIYTFMHTHTHIHINTDTCTCMQPHVHTHTHTLHLSCWFHSMERESILPPILTQHLKPFIYPLWDDLSVT